ncbi:MAG TPA: tetratricopeptide repeat protein [Myxococcales bacterium]
MNRGLGAVLLAMALGGCAAAPQRIYGPGQLRRELMRRAPERPELGEIVPFEIPAAAAARAKEIVDGLRPPASDRAKVTALVEAMFDPAGFGLAYAEVETVGAERALRRRSGNCLDLANVFIGLSRAVGVRAEYLDASHRVHEVREVAGGMTLRSGHVTAAVDVGDERVGLDFARLGPVQRYRLMDDVEAVAHFHNNRGWDLIDRAMASGGAVDWEAALSEFEAAVAIEPEFAAGWNNAGIAQARLGRRRQALERYRRAAECNPKLAAPRVNLASLLLQMGDAQGAVSELEEALRAEPGDPKVLGLLRSAKAAASGQ